MRMFCCASCVTCHHHVLFCFIFSKNVNVFYDCDWLGDRSAYLSNTPLPLVHPDTNLLFSPATPVILCLFSLPTRITLFMCLRSVQSALLTVQCYFLSSLSQGTQPEEAHLPGNGLLRPLRPIRVCLGGAQKARPLISSPTFSHRFNLNKMGPCGGLGCRHQSPSSATTLILLCICFSLTMKN